MQLLPDIEGPRFKRHMLNCKVTSVTTVVMQDKGTHKTFKIDKTPLYHLRDFLDRVNNRLRDSFPFTTALSLMREQKKSPTKIHN